MQESELKLLDSQQALIEKREAYILELRRQLKLRTGVVTSVEVQLATGAAYTSSELEKFLAEQEAQLDKDVRGYLTRRDAPALATSKGFRKVVRNELEFVAKSLSSLLQSRKTRAELVENAILFDYSYETPDGSHTSSCGSMKSSYSGSGAGGGGSANTGFGFTLGMTTDELQLLSQFHAFARQLAKENLLIKWSDLEREDKLGEGAYSVVEQGWCLGRLVAIKLFKTSRNSALQAFMREVQAMRACQTNPHAIKIIGVCVESRDRLCIITPLYKGGSVHDALYKHGHVFSPEQALIISQDLAEGLAQIHKDGFIHRDVTPTNILLHPDFNGKAFIADFGIAITHADLPVPGAEPKSPRGHPRYKAPELVSKDPYTEKIDVWQYGTMLFVLFSNRRPFESIADREVSSKMAQGELPDMSLLPQAIADIVKQCWSIDHLLRPSFAQIKKNLCKLTVATLDSRVHWDEKARDPNGRKSLKKSASMGDLESKRRQKSTLRFKGHSPQNSLSAPVDCN